MSKSVTNIIDELCKLGDRNFLLGDHIFCFGDRQTFKSHNMILKSLIHYFKDPSDGYRIVCIHPTIENGSTTINRVMDIANQFNWEIIKESRNGITIKIGENRVIFEIFSTPEQLRGRDSARFTIWDEPDFNHNKRDFLTGLAVSMIHGGETDADIVIGGSSYYPMGINPKIYDDIFGGNK